MPTLLDHHGNYPLPDSLWTDGNMPADLDFRKIWIGEMQFYQEVTAENRELLEEFAKKIHRRLLNDNLNYFAESIIQDVANEAYNDGWEDGNRR